MQIAHFKKVIFPYLREINRVTHGIKCVRKDIGACEMR